MNTYIRNIILACMLLFCSSLSYGLSSSCGLGYVAQEGKDTYRYIVSWSAYDNFINGVWINGYIAIETEVSGPGNTYGAASSTHAIGNGGGWMWYLPDPPDGEYEGAGIAYVAEYAGGNNTYCAGEWTLDNYPPPQVSLILNNNPAVIGESVGAVWTVANGAVSCTAYGPGIPGGSIPVNATGGSGQLLNSAALSDAGTYTVVCLASDGDSGQGADNLSVVECDDGDPGYSYHSSSSIPGFTSVDFLPDLETFGTSYVPKYFSNENAPAQCQSFCVAGDRRYRIVGYVTDNGQSEIIITQKAKDIDVPNCAAIDRTSEFKGYTETHEYTHAYWDIEEDINHNNNLIKLNPTYDDLEACLLQTYLINEEIEDVHTEIEQNNSDQVHGYHSGQPLLATQCDASNTTYEEITGYYP